MKIYSGMWAVVEIKIGGNVGPTQIVDQIQEKVKTGIDVIYETAGEIVESRAFPACTSVHHCQRQSYLQRPESQ